MKIIKTAQLTGLFSRVDHLKDDLDSATHSGNPDVEGPNAEIAIEGDLPHVGHDEPLNVGDEAGHGFNEIDGDNLGDNGGEGYGEFGDIAEDITQDLSDGEPLDIGIQFDPTPEQGEMPLDIEIDGHELPMDMNDPSLGLHELGEDDNDHGPTGQFDEMSLDGDLDGHLNMDEVIGDDPHGDSDPHETPTEPDMGLDGLMVIDDEQGPFGRRTI